MKDTSKPEGSKSKGPGDVGRNERRAIAKSTLEIIKAGHYTVGGVRHDIQPRMVSMLSGTRFYAVDSDLSSWTQPSRLSDLARDRPTEIAVVEISTLQGAEYLSSIPYTSPEEPKRRVGVLNFASATKPGGGFQEGARSQEESVARASTLYQSLISSTGEEFYNPHKKNPENGYYSHAMIVTPDVVVFRTDLGELSAPMEIDVVTSAAVNAGVVRRTISGRVAGDAEEMKIGLVMKERMGRILFLFEKRGIKDLVLGSFGTGAFKNNISLIAAIWAELLVAPEARFANSFDRVVFAILGHSTFEEFKDALEERQASNKG